MNTQNDLRTNGDGDIVKQPATAHQTGIKPPVGKTDLLDGDRPQDDAASASQVLVAAAGSADQVKSSVDAAGADAAAAVGEAPGDGMADNDARSMDAGDSTDTNNDAKTPDKVEDVDYVEGDNCTEEFKPAPDVAGEFQVRVGDLGDWEHHFRRFSPLKGAHSSALALSASDPMRLRPIVILEVDGRYVVVDGRFLLQEIRAAHPGDPEVMVRVVLFPGTEEEAVEAMCNEGFGREPATKMEMAHGLLALQRSGRKSQTALAEQYAALTKDKVSQMLIAARLQDGYPVLFELLQEPHRLPISFGVALNKVVKALPRAEFAALLVRVRKLVDDGERCTPDEFYDLVDLKHPAPKPAKPEARAITAAEAAVAEAIFGEDDQPIGALVPLINGGNQFFLPSPEAVESMTVNGRKEAAEGFIARIIGYFGLEKPG